MSARACGCLTLVGVVLLIMAIGEVLLATTPDVPRGLTADEAAFARAALSESAIFSAKAERAILRDVRVVSVEPDPGFPSSSSDEEGCRICGCSNRYVGHVRYYTWFNLPFARLTVHCSGVMRTSIYKEWCREAQQEC